MAITKITSGVIDSGTITSANIEDGTIVNDDINASAAIVNTKLSGVLTNAVIVGVSTFTASGTWTKATREAALGVTIKRVIVEVQGAGGSGGNSNVSNGGCGAGGGYAKKLIDVSSISSSTITVGTGGVGTSGVSTGNSGGSSSWADGTNTVTGSGGGGGVSYPSASTAGTGSGGDINVDGGRGFWRMRGNSFLGTQAASDQGGAGQQGFAGGGYGWGGATAYSATSLNGGDGIVIVWEIAG